MNSGRLFFASLLIAVFALPFWCSETWHAFLIHKASKYARQQIAQGLNDSDLIRLRFSHHEARVTLYWKHSREFRFDNEWYDIVRIHADADSVTYLCYHDKEETALRKKAASLAFRRVHNLPSEHSPGKLFLSFLKSLEPVQSGDLNLNTAHLNTRGCSPYQANAHSRSPEPPDLPPRIA